MSRFSLFGIALTLSTFCIQSAQSQTIDFVGEIFSVGGEAYICARKEGDCMPAKPGHLIHKSHYLITKDGKSRLRVAIRKDFYNPKAEELIINIGPNAEVDIGKRVKGPLSEIERSTIQIIKGSIRTFFKGFRNPESTSQVRTGTSICGIRDGKVRWEGSWRTPFASPLPQPKMKDEMDRAIKKFLSFDYVFGADRNAGSNMVAVREGNLNCKNSDTGNDHEIGPLEKLVVTKDGIGKISPISATDYDNIVANIVGEPESKGKIGITGSWSGTWRRNDTGASGGFSLNIKPHKSGRIIASFSGQHAVSATQSGNSVYMTMEPASGCKGAKLKFLFGKDGPVNGSYSVYGKGEKCNRGGTYSFP